LGERVSTDVHDPQGLTGGPSTGMLTTTFSRARPTDYDGSGLYTAKVTAMSHIGKWVDPTVWRGKESAT
jgi:hypothetical protein